MTPYGLFVQPSNSGTFSRVALSSIFEVAANVGYRLTDHWKLSLGYTLFLWDSPIRSGDQIDTVINTTQMTGPLVGPARPGVLFKEDLFWAQGITASTEFHW